MVKPGPPPKPSRLRLIEGTDRRGRSGQRLDRSREPVAPSDPPEPPYQLAPEVQAIWDTAVQVLTEMKILSRADAWMLVVYVETCALHARVTRELAGQPLTHEGSRGTPIRNQLLMIQRHNMVLLAKFAAEFGLSPSSRSRVEVTAWGSQPSGGSNPFAGGSNPFAGGDDRDFWKG